MRFLALLTTLTYLTFTLCPPPLLAALTPAGPHAVTSTSTGWQMTYDANGNILQGIPGTGIPGTGYGNEE